MADYINSSIICESYIFVPDYELTYEKKKQLTVLLKEYAKQRAPIFFKDDVFIEVELIPGSLKARVIIFGSLTAFISQYAGFRQGVEYMWKDAKFLAGAMATESMFVAEKSRSEVERVEMRTGIPGALKRVVTRLDLMEERLANQTSNEARKQFLADLSAAKHEVLHIIKMLRSSDDIDTVTLGFEAIIQENFPPYRPSPKQDDKPEPKPVAVVCRDEINAFLAELKRIRKEKEN